MRRRHFSSKISGIRRNIERATGGWAGRDCRSRNYALCVLQAGVCGYDAISYISYYMYSVRHRSPTPNFCARETPPAGCVLLRVRACGLIFTPRVKTTDGSRQKKKKKRRDRLADASWTRRSWWISPQRRRRSFHPTNNRYRGLEYLACRLLLYSLIYMDSIIIIILAACCCCCCMYVTRFIHSMNSSSSSSYGAAHLYAPSRK